MEPRVAGGALTALRPEPRSEPRSERSREWLGTEVGVTVTSVLTTANGRMVFAHPSTGVPVRHP